MRIRGNPAGIGNRQNLTLFCIGKLESSRVGWWRLIAKVVMRALDRGILLLIWEKQFRITDKTVIGNFDVPNEVAPSAVLILLLCIRSFSVTATCPSAENYTAIT